MAEDRDQERPEPSDTRVRSKRRRWWLWMPAGCFGLMVIVGLAGWAVVGGRSRARWAEFQVRHAELSATVTALPCDRKPLEGAGVPGNSWEHFENAWVAYDKLSKKEKDEVSSATLMKTTPESDALAFAVLDAHPEIFAAIREGAKCDTFDAPYEWDLGVDMPLPWLAHFRLLSRLLAADARRRRTEGNLDAALDRVRLGFEMGADVGRSGVLVCWLVGVAIRGITLSQAALIASDPALTAAQAGRLETLMVRVEEEILPLHQALRADQLATGFTFIGNEEGAAKSLTGAYDMPFKNRAAFTWRHGGSWRLAFAVVDERLGELGRLVEKGESLPWDAASKQYETFIRSVGSDPLLEVLMFAPQVCENSGRSNVARLRLIASLCHERRTGAPRDTLPLDPHTLTPLHRRVDPDKTVYWTEWSDGDQGGTGKFDENPQSTGDIPLEWKR